MYIYMCVHKKISNANQKESYKLRGEVLHMNDHQTQKVLLIITITGTGIKENPAMPLRSHEGTTIYFWVFRWHLSLIQWIPTEAPSLTFFTPVDAAALVLSNLWPTLLENLEEDLAPESLLMLLWSWSGSGSHWSAHEFSYELFEAISQIFPKLNNAE